MMKIDNPFDWVKSIQRSTLKVDFVAVSPNLKEFKSGIEEIIDPDKTTIKMMHAIIGDYGTGKSHINHYIYDRALERDDILASYVSCKNLVEGVDKGKNLFDILLNALILKLQENSPNELKNLIKDLHQEAIGDEFIRKAREKLKKAESEDDKEYHNKVIEMALENSIIKKDKFFGIIDSLQNSKQYKKKIKRIILIIDELEIFDSSHHFKSLDGIWSLRENITSYPDVIWIFSCASGSWKSLSQEKKTTDIFGENTTTPHVIPNYDSDDRKEMIWSRMFSLIPDYSIDKREEYDSNEKMVEYCFPFYNKKVDGTFLGGYDIVNMLARPELYPRRLIANCYDLYGDYNIFLKETKDEVDAYKKAKNELFRKHFFDLIAEDKFNNVSNIIWNKIHTMFPEKSGRQEDFDVLFKQLFRFYLSRKTKKHNNGFENENVHLNYINALLQQTFKLKKPIDRPYYNAYQLLLDIAEDLRERCLEKIEDPESNETYLTFKFRDFQPEGALPFLAERFHKMLDREAGPKDLVTEEQMKDIFTNLLREERGQQYDDYLYTTKKRELLEAQKIELDTIEHKGYFVKDRLRKDVENDFRSELRKLLRNDEDPDFFFNMLIDEKNGFFLPPLKSIDEGCYQNEIEVSSRGSPGKTKKEKVNVYFWSEIPDDCNDTISKNDFSLIITSRPEVEFEQHGITLENPSRSLFTTYTSRNEGEKYLILMPSNDPIDSLDYLSWRQFFFYIDEIESLAKEFKYESNINQLKKRLEYEIQHLPEKISKLPYMRWDEADIYNLRFKSIGESKIEEYSEPLSEIIFDDTIRITNNNKDKLEHLIKFYPWLIMTDTVVTKDKAKCKMQVNGKDVDEGVYKLYNMVTEKAQSLDDIAGDYISTLEKQNGIIDHTKTKEKRQTYISIKLLLKALEKSFPDNFKIENDKISLAKEVDIQEWNEDLVSWFISNSDNKIMNAIIEILHEKENILARDFLNDLNTAKNIYSNLPKSDRRKYLLEKEKSEIKKIEMERFHFLVHIQAYARTVLNGLNERSYFLSNLSKDSYETVRNLSDEIEKIIADKDINQSIVKELDDLQKASSLSKLMEEFPSFEKDLEGIHDFITISKANNPDEIKWVSLLKSKPDGIVDIFELTNRAKGLKQRSNGTITSFERDFNNFLTEKQEQLTNFRVFIDQNIELITNLPEDEKKEGVIQIKKQLEKISDISFNKPYEALKNLSKGQEIFEIGIKSFEDIVSYWINSQFESHKKLIDNYLQLSLRYTSEPDKTKKRFNEMLEELDKDIEGFKEKSSEAISNMRDLTRWTIEEPEKKGVTYRKKSQSLLKESISKEHYQYQKQAMEDIMENKLMESLVKIGEEKGEKELIKRLRFLHEMEKSGIISYRD